jgi:methionine-gamma-lyase
MEESPFLPGGDVTPAERHHRFQGGPREDRSPFLYSRWGNPTCVAASAAIARLEAGGEALVTAWGMAAITMALFSVLKAGDHIVSSRSVYGGSSEVISGALPRYGIEVSLVDGTRTESFLEALRPNTRALYCETPANPTLALVDLEGLAKAIAGRTSPGTTTPPPVLIVDSTFASPFHQQPLKLGFDMVVHSCTKYLGGHSDLTMGVVVFQDNDRGRQLRDACWQSQKLFGGIASPFEAFLLLRGIKTLEVRLARQSQTALYLAKFLETHPVVARVHYPGLESHPQHELARRQMKRGFGGMISFEIRGGVEAGRIFAEGLKLITLAVSLGGVESLVQHPASMTHTMLSEEQRQAAGISAGLIRFSVGLEDPRDLREDLEQALNRTPQPSSSSSSRP